MGETISQHGGRLTRDEITALMKGGFRYNGALFGARYEKRTRYAGSVVVSKKVAKSAVLRNKIKRRYREAMRQSLSALPVGVVILTNPQSRDATFPVIREAISELATFLRGRV